MVLTPAASALTASHEMNRDELHSPRGTVYLIPWGRWVALDPPVSLERLSMPPAVGTADGIFQL